MDLFSKFASQFKKEEPVIPEATPEPAKELEGSQLDRYEAYRKAIPDYLSLRDFKMLEAREATVEELKTMSEFDKKQRRQVDKQKVSIDFISPPSEEQIILENKEKAKEQGVGYHSEKLTTEDLKDKYGIDVTDEHAKLKNSRSTEQFFKEVMNDPIPTDDDVDLYFDSGAYQDRIDIVKEQFDKIPTKDHSILDTEIRGNCPQINYDSMPQGMKEAQERNGIKDHGLELFNKLDEPIPKEKKARVFKKDFPTPERTQTTVQRSFVGIDNGVSGSVGIIYEDGTYEFFITPVKKEQDYTKAKKMINRVQPLELAELFKFVGEGSMVMIERPMINSTRFNASMSAIRCFEATITILETLGLPYQVEDSKAWQKALLPVGITGDDLKTASKSVGNRLFPNTKLILHPDCDGMLIASYCKSKHR